MSSSDYSEYASGEEEGRREDPNYRFHDYRHNMSEEERKEYNARAREAQRLYREVNRERIREKKREWRDKNREKCRAIRHKYEAAHAEEIKEHARKWRANNAEKLKEMRERYYRNNRERILAYKKEQRGRKVTLPPVSSLLDPPPPCDVHTTPQNLAKDIND
jgi:hypothetical protein